MRPNFGDRLFIVIGICLALSSCLGYPNHGPNDFQKDQIEWLNRNLR